ncbi:hypothetical protein P4H66_23455 [Paenibacillus dokdonensis]|uniref:Uncharacterized protein n=1 Tax=Paenibacillus dokdonensis TaxID=2567944 RepID=A0ABU6GUF7_9BACL|nr:hypothetical protein [Paenibacillus dokdonensis]MEC0242772.1 hypothetical protein [Paenibacillus dokdonensis]
MRISLATGAVVYIRKNGINKTPDDQETLWFAATNPAGQYEFEVLTTSGKLYTAILNWVPTP